MVFFSDILLIKFCVSIFRRGWRRDDRIYYELVKGDRKGDIFILDVMNRRNKMDGCDLSKFVR